MFQEIKCEFDAASSARPERAVVRRRTDLISHESMLKRRGRRREMPGKPTRTELSGEQLIRLRLNAVQASVVIFGKLYQYRLIFSSDARCATEKEDIPQHLGAERKRVITRHLFGDLKKVYGRFDFDNCQLFSGQYVRETHQFEYRSSDGNRNVTVKFLKEIDFSREAVISKMSPELVSQIAHIINRNYMRKLGYDDCLGSRGVYVNATDSVLKADSRPVFRNYPTLTLLRGFEIGFQHTESFGPIVYLKNRTRVLEQRSMAEIMDEIHDCVVGRKREPDKYDRREMKSSFEEEFVGRFFVTPHTKSIHLCTAVAMDKDYDHTFEMGDGRRISIKDYFASKHGIELETKRPLIEHTSARSKRQMFWPPSVCYLTGMPRKPLADPREKREFTTALAKASAVPMRDRLPSAMALITKLKRMATRERKRLLEESGSGAQQCGLSLSASAADDSRSRSSALVPMAGRRYEDAAVCREPATGRVVQYNDKFVEVTGRILPEAEMVVRYGNDERVSEIGDSRLMREVNRLRPLPMDDFKEELSRSIGERRTPEPFIIEWALLWFESDRAEKNAMCDLKNAFSGKIRQMFFERGVPRRDVEAFLSEEPYIASVKMKNGREMRETEWKQTIIDVRQSIERLVADKTQTSALVVVLPGFKTALGIHREEQLYGVIKQLTLCQLGVVSQCIKSDTINERGRTTQAAISGTFRQLLTKLGFCFWKVKLQRNLPDGVLNLRKPTMIVGLDVCHHRKSGRSTVAFVSTSDPDFVQTYTQVAYQPLDREIVQINDFSEMLWNAMRFFWKENTTLPSQIIVFRDGVSESQLSLVLTKEIGAAKFEIAKRCTGFGFATPKMECIVVQKRVKLAFFAKSRRQEFEESAPPRTVVDTGVVSAELWDFYLIASRAPKDKCAGAVRCIVICDDLNLAGVGSDADGGRLRTGVNDLEQLTYALCCLYHNWPGAVRIPHVVKIADTAARLHSAMTLVSGVYYYKCVPSPELSGTTYPL